MSPPAWMVARLWVMDLAAAWNTPDPVKTAERIEGEDWPTNAEHLDGAAAEQARLREHNAARYHSQHKRALAAIHAALFGAAARH